MSAPGDLAYQVKQQADIVRIVGEYVKLKKSGAQNFTGLCPFHEEKTGSFSVHAGRQFFYCFGCHAKGDVFHFVQKMENCTFPESVRLVAEKMGIPLPRQTYSPQEAKEASLRGQLLELHESACQWFQQQLRTPAGAAAREYLAQRGLTAELIQQFRIGYAPDSGFALRDHLKSAAEESVMRQSGLFSFKDGSPGLAALYARFRDRIIFPIASEQGRIIAFGGRALAADKDKAGPKYLNSPETPIYSKGRVLYNLDKAREAIRKLDYSIVVEGYMDCIAVYASGSHNVIASSGTAFGEAQVKLLSRFSTNIIVNFDPDAAGAAATERSLALLVQEGFNIRVITLEPGLDPDSFLRTRGVAAYHEAVRQARKYFHYLIDRAQQQFPPRTPENKVKAVNYLLPHLQRVPSRILRDELAAEVAQRLQIDSAVLRQELRSAAGTRSAQVAGASPGAAPRLNEAQAAVVRRLLDPSTRARAIAELEQAGRPHRGWPVEPLVERLIRAEDAEVSDPLTIALDAVASDQLAEVLLAPVEEPLDDPHWAVALAVLREPHVKREMARVEAEWHKLAAGTEPFKEWAARKRALEEELRALRATIKSRGREAVTTDRS
jgi:DNA primase